MTIEAEKQSRQAARRAALEAKWTEIAGAQRLSGSCGAAGSQAAPA